MFSAVQKRREYVGSRSVHAPAVPAPQGGFGISHVYSAEFDLEQYLQLCENHTQEKLASLLNFSALPIPVCIMNLRKYTIGCSISQMCLTAPPHPPATHYICILGNTCLQILTYKNNDLEIWAQQTESSQSDIRTPLAVARDTAPHTPHKSEPEPNGCPAETASAFTSSCFCCEFLHTGNLHSCPLTCPGE